MMVVKVVWNVDVVGFLFRLVILFVGIVRV